MERHAIIRSSPQKIYQSPSNSQTSRKRGSKRFAPGDRYCCYYLFGGLGYCLCGGWTQWGCLFRRLRH